MAPRVLRASLEFHGMAVEFVPEIGRYTKLWHDPLQDYFFGNFLSLFFG